MEETWKKHLQQVELSALSTSSIHLSLRLTNIQALVVFSQSLLKDFQSIDLSLEVQFILQNVNVAGAPSNVFAPIKENQLHHEQQHDSRQLRCQIEDLLLAIQQHSNLMSSTISLDVSDSVIACHVSDRS
jgi:hypothetical protein